ncbi:MAG: bifunctional hydroxymethylpyrimidine kinase/phosphomethylpyrimidine kinase [Acidobacteriota bacterium]
MQPTALSIAGFDPSAAAGVTADLKTFSAFDTYGMAVITTLTAQNSTGVQALQPVSEEFVGQQLEAVLADADVRGVKIGMLGSARNTRLLADMLDRDPLPNVVLDPIFQTESSGELLDRKGIQVLQRKLLPLVHLVTPNLAEAALLAGMDEIHEVKAMKEAARRIHALGVRAVVVKGGRLPSRAIDVAYDGRHFRIFDGSRVTGVEARGLGCTFSSAITAQLARGIELERAIDEAKRYVTRGLKSAVRVGRGRFHLGHPVHT